MDDDLNNELAKHIWMDGLRDNMDDSDSIFTLSQYTKLIVYRHVLDTVVMLEEGKSSHPRCVRCDMKVPRKALNGRHPETVHCEKWAERKRRRLAETETRENSERAFKAYGEPMEAVSEFRYLGRLLTATDDDWPEVAGNIKKAPRSWGRMARVLGREGA